MTMEWKEYSGSWVLLPQQPVGIVHFLGGAFVGTAPQLTYKWLLEELSKLGYVVVTTPFLNTFDHVAIARQVLNRFETILQRLQDDNLLVQRYLPIYGIGHSMGSKLHLLIGSIFHPERSGNILMAFNNFPVKKSIPFMAQIQPYSPFNIEFSPNPEETLEIIRQDYPVHRNLLIQFTNDSLDQTPEIHRILEEKFAHMVAQITVKGNHLTPLGQEFELPISTTMATPLDGLGQWLKTEWSGDLRNLRQEIKRWLNPHLAW